MGRRIVSEQLQSGGTTKSPDGYAERLLKYIPSESVGFWLAVSGVIQSAGVGVPQVGLLWLFFVICLVFTFLWIRQQTKEAGKATAWTQILISCGSFIVWVIAAGGAIAVVWPGYQPLYGSLLLITYTTALSFVVPPEN